VPNQEVNRDINDLLFDFRDFYYCNEGVKEDQYIEKNKYCASFECKKEHVSIIAQQPGIITEICLKTDGFYESKNNLLNFLKFVPNCIEKVTKTPLSFEDKKQNLIFKISKEIRNSKNLVIITGAGISTDLKTIKDELTKEEYIRNWNTENDESETWDLVDKFLYNSDYHPKPNISHLSIVELEKLGYLKHIITQNVDNLHQLSNSSNVIELFGNLNTTKCSKGVIQGPCIEYLGKRVYPPICKIHDNCTISPNSIFI
jgi:hypothetical protein